jgi:predicted alpha/beta superfamily hydrolase
LLISQELTLQSKVLGEERPILVNLPAGYAAGTATYPVLYLLDGRQNMMHVAGSVEVLSRTGQIPRMIIVGIPSLERQRDLTPSHMEGFPESGGGLGLLDFIEDELMPHIERTYRTHPYRVFEGHSLGGLLSVHALLNRPDMFDATIVMSPALWWNDEALTEQASVVLEDMDLEGKAVFFGIGDEDGFGMREELKRFVAVLDDRAPAGLRWEHREFEGEGHMSAPLLINYHGLKMIFAELQLPEEVRLSFTEEAFLAHEAGITARYGSAAAQSAESYITLANALMQARRFDEAVTVFARNAEVYDRYPPSFGWLANAHEEAGNLTAALEGYQTALELHELIPAGSAAEYRASIERLEALLAGE